MFIWKQRRHPGPVQMPSLRSNAVHDSSLTSVASAGKARMEGYVPFKEMYPSLQERQAQVMTIKHKFQDKIPVVAERYKKEKVLPRLDKPKYLVPDNLNVSNFVTVIRSRLDIPSSQAIYLLLNKRTVVSMSTTFGALYDEFKDEDGFLYITYASQEMFG